MNKTILTRTLAVVGLTAWAALGVEGYRYYQATQDLSARLEIQNKVSHRLDLAKSKSPQLARVTAEPVDKE
jgi:hypothetical protein